MDTQTALQTLELIAPFSKADLKKAYRDALLVWHPDRFPDGSELKVKAEARTYKITEAYALLSKLHESGISSNVEPVRHEAPPQQPVSRRGSPNKAKQASPAAPMRKPYSPQYTREGTRQSTKPQFWSFRAIDNALSSPKALRIYSILAWIVLTPFALIVLGSFLSDRFDGSNHSSTEAIKPLVPATKSPPPVSTLGLTADEKKRILDAYRLPPPPSRIDPSSFRSPQQTPPVVSRYQMAPSVQPAPAPPVLTHLATDFRLYSGIIKDSLAASGGRGKLILENGLDADAHVKLVVDGRLAASFYVRGHSNFTFDHIPDGLYILLYCTGYGWDVSKGDFTRGRTATKYDQMLHYQTRITFEDNQRITSTDVLTLTLHKVPHGNTSTSGVSLEEFDRF